MVIRGKNDSRLRMEDGMDDVDVWHSIRFFLMVVVGITALGVAFFAVA